MRQRKGLMPAERFDAQRKGLMPAEKEVRTSLKSSLITLWIRNLEKDKC